MAFKSADKGPATAGAIKTPPPRDILGGHGDQPYGNNRFNHASSDVPGENTVSGFLPKDSVLADVQARGRAVADENGQTRTIDATGYPSAHGMAKRGVDSGSPGSTVPGKTQPNPGTQARKPS
jgi:hypothetical protein